MSFKPINISVVCEGATEVEIIKVLNKNYFALKAIFLKRVELEKKLSMNGNVSIDRLVWHINHAPYPVVTTFVDYYGFKIQQGTEAKLIEDTLKSKVKKPHFIPYLQIHETEALCFANKDILCETMNADDKQKGKIDTIISEFHDHPEEINNNPRSAPSKRLENIFTGYQKILDGKRIIQAMPLSDMISKCPHFAKWLNDIETEAEKVR